MMERIRRGRLRRLLAFVLTPPKRELSRTFEHYIVLYTGLRILFALLRRIIRVLIRRKEITESVTTRLDKVEKQENLERYIPDLGLTSREILSKARDYIAEENSFEMVREDVTLENLQREMKSQFQGQPPNSFRDEIVSMVANLVHGDPENTVGLMTKDAAESIYVAVLAYCIRAKQRNIVKPEIIASAYANEALAKACYYFGVRLVELPSYQLDAVSVTKAITSKTVAIFASCPSSPFGTVDPMEDLAALAKPRNIGLHCDACYSGFLLCGLKAARVFTRGFDFDLDGVTSISIDSNTLGGASFVFTSGVDMYTTPKLCERQSTGETAAAWATMLHVGVDGFMSSAVMCHKVKCKVEEAINEMQELSLGATADLVVVNITSETVDLEQLGTILNSRGWRTQYSQGPKVLHLYIEEMSSNSADDCLSAIRDFIPGVQVSS